MKRLLVVPLAALALGACMEAPRPTAPTAEPSFEIEDAVHNSGNEHFFFLPPMVPNPSPSGTFDGSLSPVVEICEWDGAACVLPLLAQFTTTTGPGSETVRVEPADEHYIVNWHTDEFNLDIDDTYRIIVLVDGQTLGHADVDVVGSGKDLKNVDTDEFIALKDGRTLPIKFRIEEGALEQGFQWVSVAAGEGHSCGVSSDGDAFCWGWNAAGQLGISPVGLGGVGETTVPLAVTGGVTFASMEAGTQSNCGVDIAGVGYCWGLDTGDGNLGTNDPSIACIGGRDCIFTPTPIQGGLTLASTSAHRTRACAITTTDDPYCWGQELGGGTSSTSVPTAVGGGPWMFTEIHVKNVACALTPAGQAYCWGFSSQGMVGNGGSTFDAFTTPQAVVGGLTFPALTAGGLHACGLEAGTGAAYCWGSDSRGTLGRGSLGPDFPAPQATTGGHSFTSIVGGGYHTCALTASGDAYCWGYNVNGQLGVDLSLTTEECVNPFGTATGSTAPRPRCRSRVD